MKKCSEAQVSCIEVGKKAVRLSLKPLSSLYLPSYPYLPLLASFSNQLYIASRWAACALWQLRERNWVNFSREPVFRRQRQRHRWSQSRYRRSMPGCHWGSGCLCTRVFHAGDAATATSATFKAPLTTATQWISRQTLEYMRINREMETKSLDLHLHITHSHYFGNRPLTTTF